MSTNELTSFNQSEITAYSDIDQPGCYLLIDSGLLMRVPVDGIVAGRSPCISISSKVPICVVRLSGNPWLTISEARKLAANLDLSINF